jgi:hypothetical protein
LTVDEATPFVKKIKADTELIAWKFFERSLPQLTANVNIKITARYSHMFSK